ncbi:siderophore-interacting protein [Alphaproteobacteria bacterium KMM 3653]|uniref:Siderophore-interacting protein n=1 Tax=Harenicola maris TaxID=2841044 RepID=A0AAP2CRF7_9RHOB|nr:siderophore-interacting protein [Harenicola maris]
MAQEMDGAAGAQAGQVTAQTLIPMAAPQELLAQYLAHMEASHAMTFAEARDGSRWFAQDGYRIELLAQAASLRVRLEAPGQGAMGFAKEGLVHHIAEIDEGLADAIRWSGAAQPEGELPENFRELTVLDSRVLFEGMQRVTLRYPGIGALAERGVHLRLILPRDPARPATWPVMGRNGAPVWPKGENALHARYVTLKNIRAACEEVDIDIVRHGTGMISRWAQQAKPGAIVGAMGPIGKDSLPAAKEYFIASDGTGLPVVAQMLARLSPQASGDVVVAMPERVDPAGYFPPTPLRVHTVPPQRFEGEILALAQAATAAGRTGYGFFAGEFANAQALRGHFKTELGLDKTRQISAAYWRRGH